MLQRSWPQFEIHHVRKNSSDGQVKEEWSTAGANTDSSPRLSSGFTVPWKWFKKKKQMLMEPNIGDNKYNAN